MTGERKKWMKSGAKAWFLSGALFLDFSYPLRGLCPGKQAPCWRPFPAPLTSPQSDSGWHISKEPGWLPVPDGFLGLSVLFLTNTSYLSFTHYVELRFFYKINYLKLALTRKLEPSSVFFSPPSFWSPSVLSSRPLSATWVGWGTLNKQWVEWLKFQNCSISRQSWGHNRHFLGYFTNTFLLNIQQISSSGTHFFLRDPWFS